MLFFYPRFFRVTIKSLPSPPLSPSLGARIDGKIREFKASINLIPIEIECTQEKMTFDRSTSSGDFVSK